MVDIFWGLLTAEVCLLHVLWKGRTPTHAIFTSLHILRYNWNKDFPLQKLYLLFGRCSFQTLVAPKQSVTWITVFKMHAVTFWSVYSPAAPCIKWLCSYALCCVTKTVMMCKLMRRDCSRLPYKKTCYLVNSKSFFKTNSSFHFTVVMSITFHFWAYIDSI